MIIKSLSRKKPSFDQLADYMLAEAGAKEMVRHNLPATARTMEKVVAAFEENHACLPKRANGNALFHEIIALEPNLDIAVKEQKKALVKIAERYLALRAPNQLAYGVVHTGTAHVHLHLMISSNAVFSKKREWLKKKEFADIQRDMEAYQHEHFPELGRSRHYDKTRDGLKRSNREQTMKQRTGKPSHREELALRIGEILQTAKNREVLIAELKKLNLTLYQRGRTVGIRTKGGRKYRLSSLGLATDYAEAMARIELVESRMAQLNRGRSSRGLDMELEL